MADQETSNNEQRKERVTESGTLKLLCSPVHAGPATVKDRKAGGKPTLAKSAAKIAFNNDLKVVLKTSKPKAEDSGSESERKNQPKQSVVLTSSTGDQMFMPDEATLYMMAWDELYPEVGDSEYVDKSNALEATRHSVYSALGVPYVQGGPRPELSEEQRLTYNKVVKDKAFNYYELRLSYKQKGHQAVRSRSYRTYRKRDLQAIVKRLQTKVVALKAVYSVRAEVIV